MSWLRLQPVALVLAVLTACTACNSKQKEPTGSAPAATSTPSTPSHAPSAMARPAPLVPPLLPGEQPPARGPDYFEPGEMGVGGIGSAFESCVSTVKQSDPDRPSDKTAAYCVCLVDAWRANTHAAKDAASAPPPTQEQIKTCTAWDAGNNPYAFPFPKSTPDLYKAWHSCVENAPWHDHGVYCGCYVDGVFKNPTFLKISPADDTRCDLADQYWDATKKHLTVRQFRALMGGPTGVPPDAAPPPLDAAVGRDR